MPLSFKAHNPPEGPRLKRKGSRESEKRHPLRVLDFDLENRPLSYWYDGNTTGEITAFGWSWIGEDEVSTMLLTRSGMYEDEDGTRRPPEEAVRFFREVLASADVITGHYIRRHDLPMFQAAMLEYGIEFLPPLLTQDTHGDLPKRKDLSVSQENLAAMFDLPEPKHHMTQTEWRKANRLTAEGIASARKRVVDDVIQHKALRAELLSRGLLGPPKKWKP